MTNRDDELDFMDLIRVLARYRFVVVAVAALCTLVAIVLALTAAPVYRSEIMVAAADEGGGNALSSLVSGVPSIAGLNVFGNRGNSKTAEGIAILRSPQFTVEFIEENNLLPVLFADKWDAETESWEVEEPKQIPSLLDGYGVFHNDVRQVTEDKDGIVSLAIEWGDPQLCAEWANALIHKLNLRMRQRAIDEADRTITVLRAELEKTNVVEIRQAIYSMMENQLNTRTIASVREEYAFRVISPALASDADKFIKPRRMFMVALGGVIGVALGVFFAFLIYGLRRIRDEMS